MSRQIAECESSDVMIVPQANSEDTIDPSYEIYQKYLVNPSSENFMLFVRSCDVWLRNAADRLLRKFYRGEPSLTAQDVVHDAALYVLSRKLGDKSFSDARHLRRYMQMLINSRITSHVRDRKGQRPAFLLDPLSDDDWDFYLPSNDLDQFLDFEKQDLRDRYLLTVAGKLDEDVLRCVWYEDLTVNQIVKLLKTYRKAILQVFLRYERWLGERQQ